MLKTIAFLLLSSVLIIPVAKAEEPINNWTEDLSFEPRLSLNGPTSSQRTLIGDYVYYGVAIGKQDTHSFDGLSLRYGNGSTGKKFNVSWLFNYSYLGGFEAGVSYLIQDEHTLLPMNSSKQGFALEASVQLLFMGLNFIVSKETVSFEGNFRFF
ncbi:MAG: hypothetical protein COB79_02000 [Zetaproteobacteria bacterium]|nr:MAG: hypothetical protein COB79_02000 [Zetaproteobacteria bacterium]